MALKQSKNNRLRQNWRDQESRVAKTVGGQLTKGSGNQLDKGDVKTEVFKIECKTTTHESFRVTIDIIDKIRKVASQENKIGVVVVEIRNEKYQGEVAIMGIGDFYELVGK